jgi:hypothetical protein
MVAPPRPWVTGGSRAGWCGGNRGGATRSCEEEHRGRARKKTDTGLSWLQGRRRLRGSLGTPTVVPTVGRRM